MVVVVIVVIGGGLAEIVKLGWHKLQDGLDSCLSFLLHQSIRGHWACNFSKTVRAVASMLLYTLETYSFGPWRVVVSKCWVCYCRRAYKRDKPVYSFHGLWKPKIEF